MDWMRRNVSRRMDSIPQARRFTSMISPLALETNDFDAKVKGIDITVRLFAEYTKEARISLSAVGSEEDPMERVVRNRRKYHFDGLRYNTTYRITVKKGPNDKKGLTKSCTTGPKIPTDVTVDGVNGLRIQCKKERGLTYRFLLLCKGSQSEYEGKDGDPNGNGDETVQIKLLPKELYQKKFYGSFYAFRVWCENEFGRKSVKYSMHSCQLEGLLLRLFILSNPDEICVHLAIDKRTDEDATDRDYLGELLDKYRKVEHKVEKLKMSSDLKINLRKNDRIKRIHSTKKHAEICDFIPNGAFSVIFHVTPHEVEAEVEYPLCLLAESGTNVTEIPFMWEAGQLSSETSPETTRSLRDEPRLPVAKKRGNMKQASRPTVATNQAALVEEEKIRPLEALEHHAQAPGKNNLHGFGTLDKQNVGTKL